MHADFAVTHPLKRNACKQTNAEMRIQAYGRTCGRFFEILMRRRYADGIKQAYQITRSVRTNNGDKSV